MRDAQHATPYPSTRSWQRWLERARERLIAVLIERVRYNEPNLMAIGAVGSVGFPLYYLVWRYWFPQPYENLPLRLTGMVLMLPLMLIRYWPTPWRHLLPVYWMVAVLYSLPFFFTFMLLKNDLSVVWSMSTMAAVLLLVLLIDDWTLILSLFAIGTGGAWGAALLTSDTIPMPAAYAEQLPIYLFILVAGCIFNYKEELLKRERLDAMLAVSRNMAHELRTPLLGIHSGIGGLRRYVPTLLEVYDTARRRNLDVPRIRPAHLRSLNAVLDRMERETRYSNAMIDMLLVNAGRHHLSPTDFRPVSMHECITEALDRYPFRSERERYRVRWLGGESFRFEGDRLLMVHVIFNLLRNALHAVAEAGGDGEVTLRTERYRSGGGRLCLRDTGTGIDPALRHRIFERFYSSRGAEEGAGIGLAFCRMVTDSFGGSIECHSEVEEYAEFVLHFPGASDHG